MLSRLVCHISDSFVHPCRKLKKESGKPGNGESRLYVGNDRNICEILAKKPIVFDFSDYVETPKRKIPPIKIHEQNGKKDVRRFYVGVKNLSKQEVADWTEIRKSLIPHKTCLIIEDAGDCHVARVVLSGDFKEKSTRGHSKVSLDWLEYEAKKIGKYIQHAGNGGEFSIRTPKGYKYPVDGYCEETNTVYEFQGDYYHGNPKKFNNNDLFHGKPYSDIWERDRIKKEFYESKGFNYVLIWESEWIAILKSLKSNI